MPVPATPLVRAAAPAAVPPAAPTAQPRPPRSAQPVPRPHPNPRPAPQAVPQPFDDRYDDTYADELVEYTTTGEPKRAAAANALGKAGSVWGRVRGRGPRPQPTYDGHANEDFDVPPVGGKPSFGKSQQILVRLGIPLGALALGTGIAFAVGVSQGSSRVPAAGAISQDEALRFRLSAFPVDQAAVFGERYLDVCLTQPAASDVSGARVRSEVLAQMATSGTDPGCGYSATATADASAPQSVSFTGQVRSVKGYSEGYAAFLTYSVVYDSETTLEAVVPVWVNDREAPTLMRVVGNIGFMPANRLGAPPAFTDTRTKDSTLASKLKDTVLNPFLQAWGSSDAQQLNLTITEDATFTARAGLRGVLVNPSITGVTVYTSRTMESGGIEYRSGDEVLAETHVQWTSALTNMKQSASYQIRLRLVQGKWAVVDVTGSSLDPSGGPVPNSANSGATPRANGSSSTAPSTSTSPTIPSTPKPTSVPTDGQFDPSQVPS
ncbi:conjugal transfer protein [Prescottella equi]